MKHNGADDWLLWICMLAEGKRFAWNNEIFSSLLNRSELFAGQAPETFRIGAYYEANRKLGLNKLLEINGSTEPAFIAGTDIVMIAGDENNFKITTKQDLERFEQIIRASARCGKTAET